nr:uncharacterized protein LOC105106552 isoform X3 [Camelus dromedarius]
MLYAVPPELARALTPSKADRSLCKHRVKDGLPSCPAGEAAGQGPGRSAAASLAQAPSSSLLTASSDRDGKEMGPLLLSLNKCSRTCNLLVSAWARGPHRNSWRAGSLSATCRYSRRPLSPQDDDTQKYHQEAVLGHAPLITLHPITGEAQGGDQDVQVLLGVHLLHIHPKDQLHALRGLAEDHREVVLVCSEDTQHFCPGGRLLPAILEEQEAHQVSHH